MSRITLLAVLLGGAAILAHWAGFRQLVVASSAACLIVAATLPEHVAPQLGMRLRSLGGISYSLYLVHVPIQMLVLTLVDFVAPGYRDFAHSLWVLPLYAALSCWVAYVVYHRFEIPAGRYLRGVKNRAAS